MSLAAQADETSTESDILNTGIKIQRGRKRRARYTNESKRKRNKKAVKKYTDNHPEAHRAAAKTYTKNHPDINRLAVKQYTQNNPHTNREAVKKYSQNHPDINREAVKNYSQRNPEVNREAVRQYSKNNPGINREAVKKYSQRNSEVNREAVRQYHPEINKTSVKTYNKKRKEKQSVPWKSKLLSGFRYDTSINYCSDNTVTVGLKTVCKWCKALKWKEESTGICCGSGKVQIAHSKTCPEPLYSLLRNQHPDSENFLINIRKYNSCFQMTSFGAKHVREGNFMPTFKVQGQVYHRIGSLFPEPQQNPSFLQIYFVGNSEKESDIRSKLFPGLKPLLVSQLQQLLHEYNPYIRDFKTAVENAPGGQEFKVVIRADRKPVGEHRGRFNSPSVNEVALVIVGQEFEKRDIVLHSRDSKLIRISETHRSYDALQYPLMFCYGDDGYYINLPQCDPVTKAPLNKTVSASDFYSYLLMEREGCENHILLYRSLLSQFVVDMYAKIETEKLNFIRNNQKKLRSEDYVHLRDAMSKGDGQVSNLGKMVVLPSSFTGGPRYMHERTQDAMTYVRTYGRPDLFITFTCNPKWTEITESLQPGQKPQDRHDIISRIFHIKVKKIIYLLTKGAIFGKCRCYMYTVEWQKRGLPHVHILLWLCDRIVPSDIDKIISAEIPDSKTDTVLHNIVKSTMIHGPCGSLNRNSPCMVNGRCSKKYPRPLCKHTQTADDGYPQYRRRSPNDGGFTININGVVVDNQWVVPFNPVLSSTFMAHINVELCNSVKSIKYICKYVNKGSDQAAFGLKDHFDEVSMYEAGRYISSSEAAWRIFRFHIHERHPPVMHLSVHLENGQRVYFTSDNVADIIQNPRNTTLTGFFNLCSTDSFARGLLYSEVPSYYVWKNNTFTPRKLGKPVPGHSGIKQDHVLGRVYTVHPNNAECYYLRLLLHEIRGPTCFADLKTVLGVVHPTFNSACRALGLLEDDSHWNKTLEEAALCDSPHKIRELFALMLVFCHLANPLELWERHRDCLSEDIRGQVQLEYPDVCVDHCLSISYNKTLQMLGNIVFSLSQQSLDKFGLPLPTDAISNTVNQEYLKEFSYDTVYLTKMVEDNVPKLNTEQKHVYEEIINSVKSSSANTYFLDAPGGTGKTFLINLLLASIRKGYSNRGRIIWNSSHVVRWGENCTFGI